VWRKAVFLSALSLAVSAHASSDDPAVAELSKALEAASQAITTNPASASSPEVRALIQKATNSALRDTAVLVRDPKVSADIKVGLNVRHPEMPVLHVGGSGRLDAFEVLHALEKEGIGKKLGQLSTANAGAEINLKAVALNGWELGAVSLTTNPKQRTIGIVIELPTISPVPGSGFKYQRSYELEQTYADNYHYYAALGMDVKTIPGGSTARALTSYVTPNVAGKPQRELPTPPELPPAPPQSLRAAARIGASEAYNQVRQMLWPAMDDQQQFKTIKLKTSDSLSFPPGFLAGRGLPEGPRMAEMAIKFTTSQVEKVERDPEGGRPVSTSFTEKQLGLSLAGEKEKAGVEAGAEISIGVSGDPNPEPVSKERMQLADQVQSGKPLLDVVAQMTQPLVDFDSVNRGVAAAARAMFGGNEGGVRMQFDAAMLEKVIASRSSGDVLRDFAGLGKSLSSSDPEDRDRALSAFLAQTKEQLRTSRKLTEVSDLRAISLSHIVDAAERYAHDWEALPEDLRYPGHLSRIYGYIVTEGGSDILLLGTPARDAGIPLDDLVVAVQTVWKAGAYPGCSIDPNLGDFSLPHHSRVIGVPPSSAFALTMLTADYEMKQLNQQRLAAPPSFQSYLAILSSAGRLTGENISRFWFTPIQPAAGDIQFSPDGKSAIFAAGVQVLSEQELRSKDGLAGTGTVFAPARLAAESLTRNFALLSRSSASFRELQGLFDLSLLASLWRHTGLNNSLLERLSALPVRQVDVPKEYPPMMDQVGGKENLYLVGGVSIAQDVGPRTWLVVDDPQFAALRQHAVRTHYDRTGVAALQGTHLSVADTDGARNGIAEPALEFAVTKLQSGNARDALKEVNKALQQQSFDPYAYALRAIIRSRLADCEGAERDGNVAEELATDKGPHLMAKLALFSCYVLLSRGDDARRQIEAALVIDPSSPRLHVLRGTLFAYGGEATEARREFRLAMQLDPAFPLSYSALGMLQAQQGWFAEGKRLVDNAYRLAPNLPDVKLAKAMLEQANSVYGDAAEHYAKADKEIDDVLAMPALDPLTRDEAMLFRMQAFIMRNDLQGATAFIHGLKQATPTAFFYSHGAILAHVGGFNDLAKEMMDRAQGMAPDDPMVKSALKEINK